MAVQRWQLYDTHGVPVPDKGAPKQEVAVMGLLHASAHVWLWRRGERSIELLFQKRSDDKINWPNLLDKSAGGHILVGEDPLTTAFRKAKHELGVGLAPDQLHLVGVFHWRSLVGDTGLMENEYQWVYLAAFDGRALKPNYDEVSALQWCSPAEFYDKSGSCQPKDCVPYGHAYFTALLDELAITSQSSNELMPSGVANT